MDFVVETSTALIVSIKIAFFDGDRWYADLHSVADGEGLDAMAVTRSKFKEMPRCASSVCLR